MFVFSLDGVNAMTIQTGGLCLFPQPGREYGTQQKTIAFVFGEKVLRPLLDILTPLPQRTYMILANVFIDFDAALSKYLLFPLAKAEILEGVEIPSPIKLSDYPRLTQKQISDVLQMNEAWHQVHLNLIELECIRQVSESRYKTVLGILKVTDDPFPIPTKQMKALISNEESNLAYNIEQERKIQIAIKDALERIQSTRDITASGLTEDRAYWERNLSIKRLELKAVQSEIKFHHSNIYNNANNTQDVEASANGIEKFFGEVHEEIKKLDDKMEKIRGDVQLQLEYIRSLKVVLDGCLQEKN